MAPGHAAAGAASEIAEQLALHESTISRVTNGKYMATPVGTFELKHFFGSGLSTETGGQTSSTAVKERSGNSSPKKTDASRSPDQSLADVLEGRHLRRPSHRGEIPRGIAHPHGTITEIPRLNLVARP